jgi:hypothetical protein
MKSPAEGFSMVDSGPHNECYVEYAVLTRPAAKDFFEEALHALPLKNGVAANFFFKK